MIDVRRGARPADALLTAVLLALAAWLAVLNITTVDPSIRIDTRSWLALPVFLLAVVPVLWWRRAPLAVIVVVTVVMATHDLLFGHLVRCGAGLPLAFALAFVVGLGCDRRKGLVALVLTVVLAVAVLVWDTAAGPDALPVVAVILVVLWGIGRVARSRSALGEELRQRNAELAQLRERRAAIEVADDRLRVSRQLESLLDTRLTELGTVAEAGRVSVDPQAARDALVALEDGGRRTLDDMRDVVGVLRGGEVALGPAPSVAQLESLLGGGVLTIAGDPRTLPPSLELSAYRIVEHLALALNDRPAVTVHFRPDALEIVVAGAFARGADVRGALARARERARLHAGYVEAKLARGHAHVQTHLPVPAG